MSKQITFLPRNTKRVVFIMFWMPQRGRGDIRTTFRDCYRFAIHPGRLTWNLQITHLERKIIFQFTMFRFYVNLPGCKPFLKFHFEEKSFMGNPCREKHIGTYYGDAIGRQSQYNGWKHQYWRWMADDITLLMLHTSETMWSNISEIEAMQWA